MIPPIARLRDGERVSAPASDARRGRNEARDERSEIDADWMMASAGLTADVIVSVGDSRNETT